MKKSFQNFNFYYFFSYKHDFFINILIKIYILTFFFIICFPKITRQTLMSVSGNVQPNKIISFWIFCLLVQLKGSICLLMTDKGSCGVAEFKIYFGRKARIPMLPTNNIHSVTLSKQTIAPLPYHIAPLTPQTTVECCPGSTLPFHPHKIIHRYLLFKD